MWKQVYKDNPEVLKLFGERDDGTNEDFEADLDNFLHEKGYTYLNQNQLTLLEINRLVRGAIQAQERSKNGN